MGNRYFYQDVSSATFLSRPNRFIAEVRLENGETVKIHVKNTGRCQELLVPGCKCYIQKGSNPKRKTPYDLIAVEKARPGKSPILINMDSQVVNDAVALWLMQSGWVSSEGEIKREVTKGHSRFDFCITEGGHKTYLEVKGVTLEQDGVVYFPDAPTLRGVKHIEELIACKQEGYGAKLLFVVQMEEAEAFYPNRKTHPAFADTLKKAEEAGVEIFVTLCNVTKDSIAIGDSIPCYLS